MTIDLPNEFPKERQVAIELPPFPKAHSGTVKQIQNSLDTRSDLQASLAREVQRAEEYLGTALDAEDKRASTRQRLNDRARRDYQRGAR